MNRKLLVSLLRKNIEELEMITQSFMDMEEYPSAIVSLAKRKTEDIQTIIDELAMIKFSPTILNPQVVDEYKGFEQVPETAPVVLAVESMPEPVISESFDAVIQSESLSYDESLPEVEENKIDYVAPIAEKIVKLDDIEDTKTHEIADNKVDVKKQLVSEKMGHQTTSRNEMLARDDKSIGTTLANKKISDIKQAISIGDRFRFQRELFKSNGEDMNKTLNYINQLATLTEAMGFLESKYNWDNSIEAVEDFYQIVKRKFA